MEGIRRERERERGWVGGEVMGAFLFFHLLFGGGSSSSSSYSSWFEFVVD